jgi:hypothetical protein
VVGWAFAAGWQVEHFVAALPPLNKVVPGVPWQPWQKTRSVLAARPWNAALVALSQVEPRMCGAVGGVAWHSVLLKQPGAVPGGAGVGGWPAGLFAEPAKWHRAHTAAFAALVVVCVLAPPSHGAGEWGAATVAPWQPAVLRQVVPEVPPPNLDPWQTWQGAKPFIAAAFGADLAEAPCEAGDAHPAMCVVPGVPWHSVLLKQPGAVPAGAGVAGCPAGLFAEPAVWHRAQTAAFAASVVVCVRAPPSHGAGE